MRNEMQRAATSFASEREALQEVRIFQKSALQSRPQAKCVYLRNVYTVTVQLNCVAYTEALM